MVIDELSEFEDVRTVLIGVAHHIVGRAADAEDVVQDAWVRWQTTDRSGVRNPVAFLVTVTRRLALNAATSAYARREVFAGEWLPDLTPAAEEPAREAERGEAAAAGIQLLMERLSPIERAVYLLREAFDHPFREIAGRLGLSEANARQLACRARLRLRQPRSNPVDPMERDELLGAFLRAARAGDKAPLLGLLSRGLGRGLAGRELSRAA